MRQRWRSTDLEQGGQDAVHTPAPPVIVHCSLQLDKGTCRWLFSIPVLVYGVRIPRHSPTVSNKPTLRVPHWVFSRMNKTVCCLFNAVLLPSLSL